MCTIKETCDTNSPAFKGRSEINVDDKDNFSIFVNLKNDNLEWKENFCY